MHNSYNHIISTFNWNTFLDQKERAGELQARLSAWSGINMQKEINEVFNKLCPPDQTWRIDQLELDLGVIEMDSLESDLGRRLRMHLTEKLTDLIIHADKAGQNNIEITNQYNAPIDKLRSYLLNGVMPWNYKASDGSLNQMLSWQFQHNRQMVIAMLKEAGVTHEDVRKRMAWQMNEPNFQKTIEGFEPGNHEQINRFSNELIKIQTKENVVRAGTADFKKNVWLWILNYLLTERGTLFNKHAFLKSSIIQMSGHYNIGYEELLQLLNDAVDEISKSTAIKADFLLALRALSKENAIEEVKTQSMYETGVKIDDKTANVLSQLKLAYYAGRAGKPASKRDVQLITYLLPGGMRLMQQLIKKYSLQLQPILKTWSRQKISLKLKEIFWKTVLDYASHKGDAALFKKVFTAAMIFHFPISKSHLQIASPNSLESQTYFHADTGEKISFTKVLLLIEKCLQDGTTSVVENGNTFTLHEMIFACMQYYAATSEAMQTLKVMYEILVHLLPSQPPKALIQSFSQQAITIIRKGNCSEEAMMQLVQQSFHTILNKINPEPITVITAMKKQGLRLTPALQQLIRKSIPAFDIPELDSLILKPSAKLLMIYRKGLMDELIRQLIVQQHLPSWFETADDEREASVVMQDIILHYPEKFLIGIKREVISESQMIWLCSNINLPLFIKSISFAEKNRQTSLIAFEKFYTAFESISLRGITCNQLQQILFRKLIQALISNNWKIISADQLLKDLISTTISVKNVSKTATVREIAKYKHLMPPIFQHSVEKLQENISAKPCLSLRQGDISNDASDKILQLMKTNDKPAKTGTPVRNAGIVILNSYISMLLERLNLVKDKKFENIEAQEQAVLYLQYVVTGLSHAEETELALNKVLCGLPLSKPVHDSIEVSDENKNLIEGLIKAAINYWPAIGDCSVDGFRGNWLVRDGLLIEHEDKWELVVEKRAYDILINHSPFSFSIIKYLWMNKPLHVSWAY